MIDFELKDNAFLRQFEACVEGEMAKIEYAAQERKIFLTKLIVPDSLNNSSFKEAFFMHSRKPVCKTHVLEQKGVFLSKYSEVKYSYL